MTTLRSIRSRLGWTQEQMASRLGIPRSTLADAERGDSTVSKARHEEITVAARMFCEQSSTASILLPFAAGVLGGTVLGIALASLLLSPNC